MRRLLWKEWQERRLLIALWVITAAVLTTLGKGQQVWSFQWDGGSQWTMLIVLTSLFAGLAGYGSELHSQRATFLYSRAITWKVILAAKLLLGLMAVIGSVTINAAAGFLLLPTEYHPLITTTTIALGAVWMAGLTSVAYLLGLCCSLVLPGLAGSLLVLVGWTALFGFVIGDKSFFAPSLLLLTPVVAGIVIARFGITLHIMARMLRFGVIALVFLVIGIVLDNTPLYPLVYNKLFPDASTQGTGSFTVDINPEITFAFTERWTEKGSSYYLVRLVDGHFGILPADYSGSKRWWLPNGMLATVKSKCMVGTDNAELLLSQLVEKGIRTHRIALSSSNIGQNDCALSPDSRRLLIGGYTELQLCDLTTGRVRTISSIDKGKMRLLSNKNPALDYNYRRSWWQANGVAGYIDPATQQRVLVPL